MSGWRELTVKLGAGLAVATLFLLLLEGVTRLLPLDRWEQDQPNTSYPLFLPGVGEFAGQYITNPHFAKTMSLQHFAQVKPRGIKRIFIVGGSAALGWPGPIESAFSGYLQRALNQVAPGRYEIINTASMSYGSHRLLDLLTDIVHLEPDLIVVWSGNNEYVERNMLPRFARTATMGRVQRVLRQSSLYRSVRLGLAFVAPTLFVRSAGTDITDPRSGPQVRQDVQAGRTMEVDRQVRDNYQNNLLAMARLIRKSGATGVFCTVPVNLSDWVPSRLPPVITDPALAKQWSELGDAASLLGQQGRYAEAAVVLERQLGMTPEYALGHYLLGHSYLQISRRTEAKAAFSRARDFDQRPVRALSAFEQIISAVATREGMTLIDLEAAFAAANESGVPGSDLFLDHVHPNEAGNKLAAATVLKGMAKFLDPQLPLSQLSQLIAGDDWIARHKFNQADIYFALALALSNNGDMEGAEQAYLRALDEDPGLSEPAGNLGVIYEERGDLPKAREFFGRAVRANPGSKHAANLASLLFRMGDHRGASEMVQHFLRQGSTEFKFFVMLGDIESAEGHFSQALDLYLKAEKAGEVSPELWKKIGDTYRKLGDETNAQQAYIRAADVR